MKEVRRDVLRTVIIAIVIFFVLRIFVIDTNEINGPSMEPGLQEGERILVSKVVYKLHEPERGDVIVFRHPRNPDEKWIKRIIALPGEEVEVKEGKVYIYQDGNTLILEEDSYVKAPPNYTLPKRQISANSYFVLGDNRNNSADSHNNWTVPRQNITGKAWLLICPPSEWGLASNYSLPQD